MSLATETPRLLFLACLVALGALCLPSCAEPAPHPGPSTGPATGPSRTDSTEWTGIKARIRHTFPTVGEITTEELAREFAAATGSSNLVLIDARPQVEFAVSHLRGAVRMTPDLLAKLSKDTPIVVYCSVGYRSAELAQRLDSQGYKQVRNLEGSIFEWANEGRPVYSGKEQVHKVHPYDSEWGRLLDPSYH